MVLSMYCIITPSGSPMVGEQRIQGSLRVATSRLKMDLRLLIGSSLLALANSLRWECLGKLRVGEVKLKQYLDYFLLGVNSLCLVWCSIFVDQKPLIFVKLVTFCILHLHRFPLIISQQAVTEVWLYLKPYKHGKLGLCCLNLARSMILSSLVTMQIWATDPILVTTMPILRVQEGMPDL